MSDERDGVTLTRLGIGGQEVYVATEPAARPVETPASEVARRWTVPAAAAPAAAAGALLAAVRLGPTTQGVLAAGMLAVLATVAVIDLRYRVIPNRIVGPAFACVLLFQLAFASGHALEWVLAAVGAPLALLATSLLDRRAMGMGDVKLAALLGAALGLNVVSALLVASLAVVPVALVILVRGGRSAGRTAIPFAPFLALGAAVVLLG